MNATGSHGRPPPGSALVRRKWRPSLAMIVAAALLCVAALPLAALALTGLFEVPAADRRTALAALLIAATTLVVGFVFWRTLTRPMHKMMRHVHEIARSGRPALVPPRHHGTRELAALSQALLDMAARLVDRSDYLATFAAHVSHELRSPLSAIKGAAEILRDAGPEMTEVERRRFLENILADASRLAALVSRLRELAQADNLDPIGAASLAEIVAALGSAFPSLAVTAGGDLRERIAMSAENALIVFSHLADNARRHGASRLEIDVVRQSDAVAVTVKDDGEGISESNRRRIFEPFFTTTREAGGTGMGLAIVAAMLRTHGGAIRLLPTPAGAAFEMCLPPARLGGAVE
jgi:signal transduction histidine kinase